jgi:hypothetical protein
VYKRQVFPLCLPPCPQVGKGHGWLFLEVKDFYLIEYHIAGKISIHISNLDNKENMIDKADFCAIL